MNLGFALVHLWCSSEAFKAVRKPTAKFVILTKRIKGSLPLQEKLTELVLQVFAYCCYCRFSPLAQWFRWHNVLRNKVLGGGWVVVFLDDRGAKMRAGSGFWFLRGLCWSYAFSVLGWRYLADGTVALGLLGRGKAMLLALLPLYQGRAGSLILSAWSQKVFPSCDLCSSLVQGLFAVQAAGRRRWSHLVVVWVCTCVAEGWVKAET